MDIKPLGSGFPLIDSPGAKRGLGQPNGKRIDAKSPGPSAPGLAAAREYSRADLRDPAKLEAMVRSSARELVVSGQALTGPLSDAQKTSLTDFFSSDPVVRGRIERYLEKALV